MDPRVQRTRELIREALIELIEEKGFSRITVGDIADRATVNRVTFYKHYKNKYDLVERIFEGAFEKLARGMSASDGEFSSLAKLIPLPGDTPQSMVDLFNYFAANARLFRAMLSSDGSTWFESKLRDTIQEVMRKRWRGPGRSSKRENAASRKDCMPPAIIIGLSANFLMGSIIWWLENDIERSAEDMAIWVRRYMLVGLVGTIGSAIP